MNISGSIDYAQLDLNGKIIDIFLDNHQNNQYCKNKNLFIDTYLQLQLDKKNTTIFIEELLDYTNIDALFFTKHVKRIYKFYINNKKNKNVVPFDIRNLITYIDIIYILFIINNKKINNTDKILLKKLHNTNICDLFYLIFQLFNIKGYQSSFHKDNKKKFNMELKFISKIKKILIQPHKKNIYIKKYYNLFKKTLEYIFIKHFEKDNRSILKYIIDNKTKIEKDLNIYSNKVYTQFSFIKSIKKIKEIQPLVLLQLILHSTTDLYLLSLILSNKKKHNILYGGSYHLISIYSILVQDMKAKKLDTFDFKIDNRKKKFYLKNLDKYDNCIEI